MVIKHSLVIKMCSKVTEEKNNKWFIAVNGDSCNNTGHLIKQISQTYHKSERKKEENSSLRISGRKSAFKSRSIYIIIKGLRESNIASPICG